MQITEHFSRSEFDRKPNPGRGFPEPGLYPEEWIATRLRPLCEQLEIIRYHVRERIEATAVLRIGSGYREAAYNKATPGTALKSQHMQGRAADLVVLAGASKGVAVRASVVHRLILDIYREGRLRIGGLGFYGDRFVHVDIRPSKNLVQWTGPAGRLAPE